MGNNDFEIIEKIKQLKENGNIGWAKHLIPICKSYFDDLLPLSFIKIKISEHYDFDVSIHTLKFIRTKYKKSLNTQLPQSELRSQTTVVPQTDTKKTDLKTNTPNSEKLSSREERDQLLEMAIKNMADFDNKPTERRTELDDLIERQQQQKRHHT